MFDFHNSDSHVSFFNKQLNSFFMRKTFESGHAKNVAQLEDLISYCGSLGNDFNPPKSDLTLQGLKDYLVQAQAVIVSTHTAFAAYKNAISEREAAFRTLSKHTTRIINALHYSGTTSQLYQNARTIVRKIQGSTLKSKNVDLLPENGNQSLQNTDTAATNPSDQTAEAIVHSSRQMSFDLRLDNFNKLIILLTGLPEYNPNESDLKISELTTRYADMHAKNSAAVNAYIVLTNSRLQRNNFLYKEDSGLVALAMSIKFYIKSVFGGTSPQYKQISGLKFNNGGLI